MSEEKLVPKLRFNGFDDEWIEVTINDLFDVITDYVAAGSFGDIKKNVKYLNHENHAQLIRIVDLKNNFNNKEFIYVDENAFNYLWRVNLNEKGIVLPNRGNIGDIFFINPDKLPYKNNVLAANALWLKSTENIEFKFYLMNTVNFINKLSILVETTGLPQFNKTNLKKLKVFISNSNTEMNKISNFLLMVDRKIDLLKKKHENYHHFKKYLMQQIFAQKLRFDKTYEWATYILNDIGKTYNGLSGLSKDNFEKGNSKYITYKSIFDNNILKSNFTENVELNNKSQNEVKKGDLFFTGSSETPEEVGMVSVLNQNIKDCYLNSFCFGFRLNNEININPLFLAYYLRSPIMRKKIMILAQGSTRFNLSKKEILKLNIELPSISEQQQIIDLFQNIDNKINEISLQSDNFNQFKKGLPQQMFV